MGCVHSMPDQRPSSRVWSYPRDSRCGPCALIFSTTSWRVGKISWMYKVRAEALTGRPFYQKGCRQHRGYIMGAELCQVAKRNCATHIGRCRNAMAKRWYATSYCHDPFSSAYCRDARLYIPVSYTHLTLPTIYSV